jgi:pimeloyl-ACP methyl ester carboxylesterase
MKLVFLYSMSTDTEIFPAHAQDMFGVFHGTALDTSLLIDHLGSYIFHGPDSPTIDEHLVLGISLGGHAAWQVFFHEPRVTAAIVIIGCPDYLRESLCVELQFVPRGRRYFPGNLSYLTVIPLRTLT